MALNLNTATLCGRLAKDIDLRKTTSGLSCCSFTVAVDRANSKKDANGERPVDFINCQAWRQQADFLGTYAHKGDTVLVQGSTQTRNYEKDGKKVYVQEIVAESVQIMSKAGTTQGNVASNNYSQGYNQPMNNYTQQPPVQNAGYMQPMQGQQVQGYQQGYSQQMPQGQQPYQGQPYNGAVSDDHLFTQGR